MLVEVRQKAGNCFFFNFSSTSSCLVFCYAVAFFDLTSTVGIVELCGFGSVVLVAEDAYSTSYPFPDLAVLLFVVFWYGWR